MVKMFNSNTWVMIWCMNPQKLDKHDKQCNYELFINFITITTQCTTEFTFTFKTALTWSQDGYKQWYVF